MTKGTIRLTESRLRELVESCVKEALEDTIEEGFATDLLKDYTKVDLSDYPPPSFEEFMELVKGEPDKAEFLYNKLMYNQSKAGHISDTKHDTDYYAREAFNTEPGMKGQLRRAATGAAAVGKYAYDKAKSAFKGKKSKQDNDEYGSFTM